MWLYLIQALRSSLNFLHGHVITPISKPLYIAIDTTSIFENGKRMSNYIGFKEANHYYAWLETDVAPNQRKHWALYELKVDNKKQ